MIEYVSDTAFRLDGELVDIVTLRAELNRNRNGRNNHRLDTYLTRVVSGYGAFVGGYAQTRDLLPIIRAGLRDLRSIW